MYCRVCDTESNHDNCCTNCGYRPDNGMGYIQRKAGADINPGFQHTEADMSYAGFWIRAAAGLIDGLVVSIPLVIVLMIYLDFAYNNHSRNVKITGLVLLAALLLAMLVYYAGMHASVLQATFGKRLCGIMVLTVKGERISFLRGAARYLAGFLSGIFYIGFILAGLTERKQSLHDLIARTIVVYGKTE